MTHLFRDIVGAQLAMVTISQLAELVSSTVEYAVVSTWSSLADVYVNAVTRLVCVFILVYFFVTICWLLY